MISEEFLKELDAKYPELERVGDPLTAEQVRDVEVGGVSNHPLDLNDAFDRFFQPGSEHIKRLVHAALHQNR